jgi:hypothetical protein
MPPAVLALVVNIKAVLVVLDRGYAVSPFDESGNKFFYQRCFAGIGFTDNGYDWSRHILKNTFLKKLLTIS